MKTKQTPKCTFNACKNIRWSKGDDDLCKKHFQQGINSDNEIPKPTEYDKTIDALNFIDNLADYGVQDMDLKEAKQLQKAYTKVADFINKYTKR